MARQRGFTLLEIMIVIVIIGILATFATLSIGDRALDDRLEAEARRVEQILRLAEDEADLKGLPIGLRVGARGYRFLVIDNERHWRDYAESGLMRSRMLLEPFYAELRIEGRLVPPAPDDIPQPAAASTKASAKTAAAPSAKTDAKPLDEEQAKKQQPQVMLLPGSQMTPFTLDIRAPNYASYFRIEGDALGRITRTRLNDNDRYTARGAGR